MTMNTAATIEWFEKICNKEWHKFVQMFMKGFCLSISQTTWDNDLLFANFCY